MTRWFRHYGGMMRDEKLVRVAVKAGQPVERVMWVWSALLESAGEVNDGGRYDFDAAEAAYFLRCDVADVSGILDGLEASGRINSGVVVRWGDRQFDSDSSKERQRRYRAKRNAERDDGTSDRHDAHDEPSGDGEVTLQEDREQITDTTSLRSVDARAKHDAIEREFIETFWPRYPHKIGKPAALKSYHSARRRASMDVIVSGLERYIRAKPPDRSWCNPATFLNQERWADQPATIAEKVNGNGQRTTTASLARQAAEEFRRREGERSDGGDLPAVVELSRAG